MADDDANLVQYSCADRIATITLNRPDKLNAVSDEVVAQLAEALRRFDLDEAAEVAIINGKGRAFSSGADVRQRQLRSRDEFEKLGGPQGWGTNSADLLTRSVNWKPVIAAVHGLCAGGAFYFINEADIIICSEDAQFFDPHVSFGLVPACEPVGASHRMPYGEIMRMILMGNGERIGAETALRINLVSEVVENAKLADRAHELAALIASRPSTATQGAVRAMWESLDLPYSAALRCSYKYTQVGNPVSRLDRSTAKKEPFTVR